MSLYSESYLAVVRHALQSARGYIARPKTCFGHITSQYPNLTNRLLYIYSTTTTMNTTRAGRLGGNGIKVFQLAGSLDAVVAVVGMLPGPPTGEMRYDRFIAHLSANPHCESNLLSADKYKFAIEELSQESWDLKQDIADEHTKRIGFSDCSIRCDHAPLPSLFPNLNWTFAKGSSSFDQRRAEFGHTSETLSPAPDSEPRAEYEATLERLGVMVNEAKLNGLSDLRIVVSATDPVALSRFSDQQITQQQVLINSCLEISYELGGHVELRLRNVGTLRQFVVSRDSPARFGISDHTIPSW